MTWIGQGQLTVSSDGFQRCGSMKQVLLTAFGVILWRSTDGSFSAQGGSVQIACFSKMSYLFWNAARPLMWVVCAVSKTSGPKAWTCLCLSEQMNCRKQAASLWDKHRSDVRGPAQAGPWGRCLRDVGIWVTWRENSRRGQVRIFRIFWNNFVWLSLETRLAFRGLVGASCSLLGVCVEMIFGFWQYT